jgi:cyanophycinase
VIRRLAAVVILGLLAGVGSAEEVAPRGHLILVGGGDKPPEAMRKFVELAGGAAAPIVVIPTASTEADIGSYYAKLFAGEYGCSDVAVLDIKSPADARRPDFVERAARARGVFFGGGDQERIMTALSKSPVLAAITAAFERGAVVGGTSAGTACQSALMITGMGDFEVIRSSSVELWDGLGFFRGVVVDQHFVARARENRLLSVILEHPDLVGVGVDEDTAVWVRPDNSFQVIGERAVMVLDATRATVTRQPTDTGQDRLGVHDLTVHVLLPGETFDLGTRTVVGESRHPGADRKGARP